MKLVCVMMSTYNGEKYVEEQIESIMSQKDVVVDLIVRDDGSQDGTVACVKKLMKKYPNNISLIEGENIGYRKSFLRLLKEATKADYYAFSDQDDVWLPDKCIEAINCIEKFGEQICLYASGLKLVDENLKEIYVNDIHNVTDSLEGYFARGRLAGCTYVFTTKLKEKAQLFWDLDVSKEKMPAHDFIVGSIAYACGEVYLDNRTYILHRRHKRSLTSGGRGIINRIETEWNNLTKTRNINSTVSVLILKKCSESAKKESITFLKIVSDYRKNIFNMVRLITYPGFTTGNVMGDLLTKFKVLIGLY